MNSDTFACIGNLFPSTHPFFVASQTAAQLGTTERAFVFGNGNVAVLSAPLQTDIRGSATPFDPEVNAAVSVANFGSRGGRMAPAPWFNSNTLNNRPFRVRAIFQAAYTAAGGGASTVVFNLYAGNSATVGSDTKIANSGSAVSVSATKVCALNCVMEAEMQWDSGSQSMAGIYQSFITGSVDTSTTATIKQAVVPATALNLVTGITSAANIQFVASCTIGTTAAASGSVSLIELSMEQV